jgi:transposase
MQIIRGYKTELDFTNEQVTLCKKHAGASRWAYNWGLRRRQEVYKAEGRSIWSMELHRELNVLKQTEVPWMYVPCRDFHAAAPLDLKLYKPSQAGDFAIQD